MVKISDFFGSLFGPPKERLGPEELPRNIREQLEHNFHGHRHNPEQEPWPLGDSQTLDAFDSLEKHFFRDVEDIFHNFFSGMNFGFQPHEYGADHLDMPPPFVGAAPEDPVQSPDSRPLRDRMLKAPHREEQTAPQHPFAQSRRNPREHLDTDLDTEVEEGTQSLDEIIAPKRNMLTPFGFTSPHSSSSSFSSVTIISSNGVTEKRITRRGSDGNEEEIVTKQIGDQSHTVTRRRDESGNEETQEDLVNIAQGEKDDFDERCSQSRSGGPSQSYPDPDVGPLSSVLGSIMEQFFPRWPR